MSREIHSDSVRHGRNAETVYPPDNKYIRCWNCGFICNTDRDLHVPKGSRLGDGITTNTINKLSGVTGSMIKKQYPAQQSMGTADRIRLINIFGAGWTDTCYQDTAGRWWMWAYGGGPPRGTGTQTSADGWSRSAVGWDFFIPADYFNTELGVLLADTAVLAYLTDLDSGIGTDGNLVYVGGYASGASEGAQSVSNAMFNLIVQGIWKDKESEDCLGFLIKENPEVTAGCPQCGCLLYNQNKGD